MSEEAEVETKDLQETIEELHEERREREESERKAAWTRYIALTTAILAVFAAIGALQSGNLVNHALIYQLQASDKWNEYQADRQKQHLYSTLAYGLLDSGVVLPAGHNPAAKEKAGGAEIGEGAKAQKKPHAAGGESHRATKGTGAKEAGGKTKKTSGPKWTALSRSERLDQYVSEYEREDTKTGGLQEEAKGLEEESKHELELHHEFATSVALIQVAIALSAIAALTRIKYIWALGMAAGVVGIILFSMGFIPH